MTEKFICVFAGSGPGSDPEFVRAARVLAEELTRRGYGVVYGGAHVGLMGALADAALECGTSVIGVIPEFLMAKEVAHTGLTELKITTSMHERKAVMAELSSAFIALPGGMGTMEEFFEVLTWGQLGLHGKPCGLLNVNGYYDSILSFLDNAVAQRLLSTRHRSSVLSAAAPAELLDQIEAFQPIVQPKWL